MGDFYRASALSSKNSYPYTLKEIDLKKRGVEEGRTSSSNKNFPLPLFKRGRGIKGDGVYIKIKRCWEIISLDY